MTPWEYEGTCITMAEGEGSTAVPSPRLSKQNVRAAISEDEPEGYTNSISERTSTRADNLTGK